MKTIPAKKILTHVSDSSYFGNDYNMNLYKGCCHGCIYCDSRSSCYQIENFDEVRGKEDAISILERELRSKQKSGVIGTGSMSDPYNPYEEKHKLTRQALELIDRYHFGVSIATKSPLITRDIDILKRIKSHSPVLCKITITTSEDELSRKVEPKAAPSSERFKAIQALSQAGIYAGILMTPVLPFLTDTEENVIKLVCLAHEHGARFIFALFGMTLRNGQREYYYGKLKESFPDKDLVRLYSRQYGDTYECHSPQAKQLKVLFQSECERYGILYRMQDIIDDYKAGYTYEQLSLFP
jgi:DNA repair photolyase